MFILFIYNSIIYNKNIGIDTMIYFVGPLNSNYEIFSKRLFIFKYKILYKFLDVFSLFF